MARYSKQPPAGRAEEILCELELLGIQTKWHSIVGRIKVVHTFRVFFSKNLPLKTHPNTWAHENMIRKSTFCTINICPENITKHCKNNAITNNLILTVCLSVEYEHS